MLIFEMSTRSTVAKDNFPFPHIDMLVDNTTGHSMLSFMDGFFWYSHIMMAP